MEVLLHQQVMEVPAGDGVPLAPAGDGGPPPPPLMVPAGLPPVGDRGPRPPPPPVVPAPPVIPPPIIPPPAVPAPFLPPAAHVAALQHHRQQVLRQLRALNREIVRFDYNDSVRLIYICDLAGENGPFGGIGCYYHKKP